MLFWCNRCWLDLAGFAYSFIQTHLSHLLSSPGTSLVLYCVVVLCYIHKRVNIDAFSLASTMALLLLLLLFIIVLYIFIAIISSDPSSRLSLPTLFLRILSNLLFLPMKLYGKFIHVMMHFSLLRLFMQAHYNPSISTNCLFIFLSFFRFDSLHSFTYSFIFFPMFFFAGYTSFIYSAHIEKFTKVKTNHPIPFTISFISFAATFHFLKSFLKFFGPFFFIFVYLIEKRGWWKIAAHNVMLCRKKKSESGEKQWKSAYKNYIPILKTIMQLIRVQIFYRWHFSLGLLLLNMHYSCVCWVFFFSFLDF